VAVSARDLVDSFSIAATNNRLFIDTIIRARPALIIPPDVFTFYLSFADTGWQKVTIGTFRKNDDKVSIDYSLFCTSPLHQDSIGGTYNDSIVLSTNPVADENVVYHWDFGTERSLKIHAVRQGADCFVSFGENRFFVGVGQSVEEQFA